jgi:hypothetical protein
MFIYALHIYIRIYVYVYAALCYIMLLIHFLGDAKGPKPTHILYFTSSRRW